MYTQCARNYSCANPGGASIRVLVIASVDRHFREVADNGMAGGTRWSAGVSALEFDGVSRERDRVVCRCAEARE